MLVRNFVKRNKTKLDAIISAMYCVLWHADLQYFCADLKLSGSANDQLLEIQEQHPKYFSSDVISTEQVLRLLEKVIQHGGGKASPTEAAAESSSKAATAAPASTSNDRAESSLKATSAPSNDPQEISASFDDDFDDSFDGSSVAYFSCLCPLACYERADKKYYDLCCMTYGF